MTFLSYLSSALSSRVQVCDAGARHPARWFLGVCELVWDDQVWPFAFVGAPGQAAPSRCAVCWVSPLMLLLLPCCCEFCVWSDEGQVKRQPFIVR
jgi:hypothetical protein